MVKTGCIFNPYTAEMYDKSKSLLNTEYNVYVFQHIHTYVDVTIKDFIDFSRGYVILKRLLNYPPIDDCSVFHRSIKDLHAPVVIHILIRHTFIVIFLASKKVCSNVLD